MGVSQAESMVNKAPPNPDSLEASDTSDGCHCCCKSSRVPLLVARHHAHSKAKAIINTMCTMSC